MLNIIIFVHVHGVDAGSIRKLIEYPTQPDFQDELFNDLLQKRNQHLLSEIQTYLLQTDHVVVPWGVAHMPEIAREIQKSGFTLNETQDFTVIRFHGF
jgi:DNA-binding transcriptional MerR regulator